MTTQSNTFFGLLQCLNEDYIRNKLNRYTPSSADKELIINFIHQNSENKYVPNNYILIEHLNIMTTPINTNINDLIIFLIFIGTLSLDRVLRLEYRNLELDPYKIEGEEIKGPKNIVWDEKHNLYRTYWSIPRDANFHMTALQFIISKKNPHIFMRITCESELMYGLRRSLVTACKALLNGNDLFNIELSVAKLHNIFEFKESSKESYPFNWQPSIHSQILVWRNNIVKWSIQADKSSDGWYDYKLANLSPLLQIAINDLTISSNRRKLYEELNEWYKKMVLWALIPYPDKPDEFPDWVIIMKRNINK